MRCVTWNIHGAVGRDGQLNPERIAQVLTELQADLVALQEVHCPDPPPGQPDILQLIAERTGLTPVAGPARPSADGDGYFGNALLTRCPVQHIRHHNISVSGREPRSVLHVDLAVDQFVLRVLVTHFGLRASERLRQVDALVGLLDAAPDVPALVAGDFNEWRPRALTLSRLHLALGRAPAVRSFPARLPLLKLDRIWVRPSHALQHIYTHRSPLAQVASDHLPVVAQLKLT